MATTVGALQLSTELLTLHLRHTFTIARLVRLRYDGVDALGESSPIMRYDENTERVARELERLDLSQANPWAFDDVLDLLSQHEPAARCALALAVPDLA